MHYYFKGKIVYVGIDTIAIDVHDVAYELFVSKPELFSLGEECTVYSYEVYGENDHYLAGFKTLEEKEAFNSLIGVKGIGPKTALNALSTTTPTELFEAVAKADVKFLKKLPGIGPKAASQIILDLQGKLTEVPSKAPAPKNDERFADVRAALKQLGFKVKDIDEALSKIDPEGKGDQELLKLALKALRKG
ncbi:MAG: Holliday junction branch migration protein RuvA [Bacilli bacterium]|nr:Holliday junction branch migration protein RuvA [Bacilli bacterium]